MHFLHGVKSIWVLVHSLILTLLHSEWLKLYGVLTFLTAIGLKAILTAIGLKLLDVVYLSVTMAIITKHQCYIILRIKKKTREQTHSMKMRRLSLSKHPTCLAATMITGSLSAAGLSRKWWRACLDSWNL